MTRFLRQAITKSDSLIHARCGWTVIPSQFIVVSRPSALRGADAGHISQYSILPGPLRLNTTDA